MDRNIINQKEQKTTKNLMGKKMSITKVYQDIMVNGDIISATRYTFRNGKQFAGDVLIIDKGETKAKNIHCYGDGKRLLRELQIVMKK